jgi:hypothetical protein
MDLIAVIGVIATVVATIAAVVQAWTAWQQNQREKIETKPSTTPIKVPPPNSNFEKIKVDYINLRNLLEAEQWKQADEETWRVMLKIAKKGEEEWLSVEDLNNFPCTNLQEIDRLWVQYSSGRFGFSIQKHIWQELGGKVDVETEKKLGDRVGWRLGGEWVRYDHLTFSIDAPLGHLPVRLSRFRPVERGLLGLLFTRL